MKLVRDRIGDIPWPDEQAKQHLGWVDPDTLAYRQMLREKLREEVEELLAAHRAADLDGILDEAADVFEVLRALLVAGKVATPSTARQVLANAVDRKFVERGGFLQGRTWSGPERAGHPAGRMPTEIAEGACTTWVVGPTLDGRRFCLLCGWPESVHAMQEKINRTVEDMRQAAERGAVPFVHTLETPPTTQPAATQAGEAAPAVPREAPNAPEGAQADEVEDDCPHCSPTHGGPERCAWGVRVDALTDGDGQPVRLIVEPTDGAHVAPADARWLFKLMSGPPAHAAGGGWIRANVFGPDAPMLWITVINDTRSGVTPYAFTDRDEAIEYARKTAEECAREPGDIREETYPDYAYYVRYSSESNAWVVGVRLNAEVVG